MSAGISVNLRSPVPPFEQIRAQITSLITVGTLAPGTRLPTVRSLASDLGLAAGTVARAYKELELAGLIETRRRNGTVVAGTAALPARAGAAGQSAAQAPATAEVIAAVDRYIAEGRRAGLDDAALLALLRTKLTQQDK
ncbi:DNA-binding transcriptional regulator YhcF, GntR family [Arthrobacter sp. ov407]|uniref:GntR family transcriptional regulator n=1 Tax=Arthrobacter sp. ov407 TaxID=1761748 RepID=UPI00088D88F0|nr:GntR family transcriptional regulator [Arthrobacter sp. ov407]SDK48518.1 DNA-binding transcriptional regulator YhcF, GntR family [Arthrobacter sp. ov407]